MMLLTSSVLVFLLPFALCQDLGSSGPNTHSHGDVPDLGSVLNNLGSSQKATRDQSSSVPDIASIDVNVVGSSSSGPGVPDLVDAAQSSRDRSPPLDTRSSGGSFEGRQGMGPTMDRRGGFDQGRFDPVGMGSQDFGRFDRGDSGRGGRFRAIDGMDRGVPYFMGGESGGPGRGGSRSFFDGPGTRLGGGMAPDFGMPMMPDRRRGMDDRMFGRSRSDPRGFMDMGSRGMDRMDAGRFQDPMGGRFDSMGPGGFGDMRSGRMPMDMGPRSDSFMGSSRRTGGGFDPMGPGFDRMGRDFDRRGRDRMDPFDRAGGMMAGDGSMSASMGGGMFNESGMGGDMGSMGRDMGGMSPGDRRSMGGFSDMGGRSSGMRYEPRFAMDPRFTGDRYPGFPPEFGRMGGRADFSRGSYPPEYFGPYGFSSRMSRFASFGSPSKFI